MKKVKLTEEDALALSYLTPGLSRRIQKQLFAQLSCPEGQTQNASTLPRRRSSMTQRPLTVDSNQHRLAESSSLGKLRYHSTLSENPRKESTIPETQSRPQTRRVSRFLRPDFYDNAPSTVTTTNAVTTNNNNKTENLFHKEKKEREMETQKVLKEIRDKRIKNRLNIRRERSMSREKEMGASTSAEILMGYSTKNQSSIPTYVNDSVILNTTINKVEDSKTEDNNTLHTEEEKPMPDYVNVPSEKIATDKKERVSKLMRPKSYPNEKIVKSPETSTKSSKVVNNKVERSLKTPETYSSDAKTCKVKPAKSNSGTKNRFLQTIEKKFEKLRSLNNNSTENSTKDDNKKSCVESAIRKLREHSVPKQTEELHTESTLIKRAVSVEDCTTNQQALLLQPSRKSVTKILGLFKKYEDKQKERTKSPETTSTGINSSSPVIQLNEISETNIPRPKKMPNELLKAKSPELVEQHRERPKSLMIDSNVNLNRNGHSNGIAEGTYKSRLPLMNSNNRRSLQIDDNITSPSMNNNPVVSPITPTSSDRIKFSENSIINDIAQRRAEQRKNLQLDLNLSNSRANSQLLTPDNDTTSSCTLLSPYDDTVSCSGDSNWSVCSDQGNNFTQSTTGQTVERESNGNDVDQSDFSAGDSVIDRIRRKSFYSRFNDQRRSRKTPLGSGSSLAGSYRDLDLYRYRDYNQPTPSSTTDNQHSTTSNPHKRTYSRSSSHMPDYSTITNIESSSTLDRKKEYRPYGRSTSMLHEYVNMPSSIGQQTHCGSIGNSNARLLSYTKLYHDDTAVDNGNANVCGLRNGADDYVEDESEDVGKLGNRYRRYNYRSSSRQSSNASTRSSVSPSPTIAHVHDPITATHNSVVISHLKSTPMSFHNDKY